VAKPKVFIGSSKTHVKVADAIKAGLGDFAETTVWHEGLFGLNDNYLQRLVESANKYDFAVMIWAPDDVTESKGLSQASPRDNVIFECGLFMGLLGEKHVFIVRDSHTQTKIPSDFDGRVLAEYDGTQIEIEPESAVGTACFKIKNEMVGDGPKSLQGQWTQMYTEAGDIEELTQCNDIEVITFVDTVSFVRHDVSGSQTVFEARGRFVDGSAYNRIRGEWRDSSDNCGAFLLFLKPGHDIMYGYNASYDPEGAPVFRAWVLAKGTANLDTTNVRLAWGRKTLKERTIEFPVKGMATGA
jgi:hypothetical protein